MLLFLLFSFAVFCIGSESICEENFQETVCKNIDFQDDTRLQSNNKELLVIANSSGTISAENFANLLKIEEVTLMGNDFNKISDSALCFNNNIKLIKIVRNKKIPKISNGLLSKCANLKKIFIDGNAELENGVFDENTLLETISINSSIIPEILTKDFFKGLESLTTLTISHSNLKQIEENAFDNLEKLKTLDLQSNKIEKIPKNVFNKLKNLRVLNLAENKIDGLQWDEFEGLESLRVLYLEGNSFDNVNIERLIQDLPSLERIFFTQTNLNQDTRKKIEEVLNKRKITFIYIGPAPLF